MRIGMGLALTDRYGGGGGAADPFAVYAANSNTPELAADFAATTPFFGFNSAASDFATMFTFARASTATYTNSSGNIVTASSGTARTDAYYYNGTSYVKGGLRLESAAATNLYTDSKIAEAYWLKQDVTLGTPLSTKGLVLEEVTEATTTADHRVAVNGVTIVSGDNYTFSAFVKAGTRDDILIGVTGGSVEQFFVAVFNTTTGAFTATDVGTSTGTIVDTFVEDYGDGVYRIAISGSIATTTIFPVLNISDSSTPTINNAGQVIYLGDGSTFYAGETQFETGSVPSSYIPTSGSTVTRAAETISIAGADTPANTTAISIAMNGLQTYADEGAAAQQTLLRWQADASNYIILDMDTDGAATGEINANQNTVGTLDTVVAAAEYSPGINVAFSIASRHTSGAINVAKDGTAATADTTPTALANLAATAVEPGYDFNGFVSEFIMWGTDIADAGIEEAST